jgi:pimeloyl-ACP methyl ester carboxylesterase
VKPKPANSFLSKLFRSIGFASLGFLAAAIPLQIFLRKEEVEESFRQNRRESYAQGPGYLLQEVQALYSDPRIDRAHLAACTVLISHGMDDQVVPVEVARDLHARIPGSGYQELPGQGALFCVRAG